MCLGWAGVKVCLGCLQVWLFFSGLHQLLGFEEAFEVFKLPDAGDDEDERLGDGPPQHTLVGALAGHAEALFTVLQGTDRHVQTQPSLQHSPRYNTALVTTSLVKTRPSLEHAPRWNTALFRTDRTSTRLNSSHKHRTRMPSSA